MAAARAQAGDTPGGSVGARASIGLNAR